MNKTPIYTDITNNTKEAFFFRYAAKEPVWLPAGETVRVPYELWSVADNKIQSGLLASITTGQVSLTVGILNKSGEYTVVDYAPEKAFGFEVAAPAQKKEEEQPKEHAKVAHYEEHRETTPISPDDHIVTVGSDASEKAAEHFGMTAVPQGVPEQSELIDGVPQDVKKEDVVTESAQSKYEAAVAEKRWGDAVEVLTSLGAEGVTSRSLSSLKDKTWDAVKERYKILQ